MEEKIKRIFEKSFKTKLTEDIVDTFINDDLGKSLKNFYQEAQKELLEEIEKDFAEGNPAEHICMKFIDRLNKNN